MQKLTQQETEDPGTAIHADFCESGHFKRMSRSDPEENNANRNVYSGPEVGFWGVCRRKNVHAHNATLQTGWSNTTADNALS
jgi:hypothetical protein